MRHTEFFAAVKAGNIAPCVVLEGTEEFTKEAALEALRKKLLPAGLEAMNEARLTNPPADEVIAAAETFPLMAERRLVLIKKCGMLSGKAGDFDESAHAERLIAYFKAPADTAVVAFFVSGRMDRRKKLAKALEKEKNVQVVSFEELTEQELIRWIAQSLKKLGKSVNQETCQALIFTSGRDLYALDGEIGKLAAYAEAREAITSEDIAAICTKTTEYKVFDLALTLLSGQGERALAMARELTQNGEEPLFLLALLQRQCKQLMFLKPLLARRASSGEMAGKLGVPPAAIGEMRPVADKLTKEKLLRMANVCMDSEYLFKSGKISQEGLLDKVMLELLSEVKGAC